MIRKQTILCHERLAIVGVDSGAQPLISDDGKLMLAVNGEIYNYKALKKGLRDNHTFKTHSDCEVILYLYREHDIDLPKYLDGQFSFVLYDEEKDRLIAARDPIGITSLYQGFSSKSPETVYFSSELKSLQPLCDKIIPFPPGHVFDSESMKTTRYFDPSWRNTSITPSNKVNYTQLREALEDAVRKRLMSDVWFGVLLSGGLDSSLIAAIAAREVRKNKSALWNTLPSYSIGLENSPDLLAAQKVADFLGTSHHNFTFTIEEGLDALHDVIYHLETFDVTTIRASVPMYLLSRKIKAYGVKMVLSGEGSDEVFGGYLYFSQSPTPRDLYLETVSRVENLHLADCLRANKSTMAWGLEARVPFLDKEFLDVAMNLDPQEKMYTEERREKYIVRKAFDPSVLPEGSEPYLPHDILWRQKEQFSDGVGYGWIDALRDVSEKEISDEMFLKSKPEWGNDKPSTKEAYWYRTIFDSMFTPAAADTVQRWIPRADWGCPTDPSGRAQKVHETAYENDQ